LNTKDKILKIAKKEFSKNGYANTSLDVIAKKVGVSKPAIYYYFKSKKDLYNEIFKIVFDKFNLELTGELEVDLRSYIEKVSVFLSDVEFAKIFSMELSSGMRNLKEEAIIDIVKLLKILSEILKDTNINPFFIQTLIISSIITYMNTLSIREKVSKIVKNEKLDPNFDLKSELISIILKYVKERL